MLVLPLSYQSNAAGLERIPCGCRDGPVQACSGRPRRHDGTHQGNVGRRPPRPVHSRQVRASAAAARGHITRMRCVVFVGALHTSGRACLGWRSEAQQHPLTYRTWRTPFCRYFFEIDGGKKIRPTMVSLMSRALIPHAADEIQLQCTSSERDWCGMRCRGVHGARCVGVHSCTGR